MNSEDIVLSVLGIGAVGLIAYLIYKRYFTAPFSETVVTPLGVESVGIVPSSSSSNNTVAEQGAGGYTIVVNTPLGAFKIPGPLGNSPFRVANLGLINASNINQQQFEQEVQQAQQQGLIPVFVNAPQ